VTPRAPGDAHGAPDPLPERSAILYNLLGSCRRHQINPFDYLKDLFMRLPAAKISQIKEFTPAAWARANAKEKLVALKAWANWKSVKLGRPVFDF
jgi:hypothetical protein